MLARLLQAATLTTIAFLIKRLFTRHKSPLPYRRPDSNWPNHSYRKPSWSTCGQPSHEFGRRSS